MGGGVELGYGLVWGQDTEIVVAGEMDGDDWGIGIELGEDCVLEAELKDEGVEGDEIGWVVEDRADEQVDDTNLDGEGEVGDECAYHWPGSVLWW